MLETVGEFKDKLNEMACIITALKSTLKKAEEDWNKETEDCEFRIDGDLNCVAAEDPFCACENCPFVGK